jgi:type IV pilus assembly protein PilP
MSKSHRQDPHRLLAWMLPPLAALSLSACDSERAEIQTWMDEARRNTTVRVDKLPEPKSFEPFRYRASTEIDPFSLGKLKVGVAAGRPGGGVQPDLTRRREPLESYPLDNLRLVGNLRQGAANIALLQADTALHQVRVGNYVGQNFGRIMRISETEVAVKELVQDAAGDWVERDTALRLQETSK